MKRRLLSFLLGRHGWLRHLTMWVLNKTRGVHSLKRPDLRFIRTLQSPEQVHFDKHAKRWRISSAAFGPSTSDNALSGDLEELLADDGLPPTILFPSLDRAVGAAAFTVAAARSLGLRVQHDPVSRDWYHGATLDIVDRHKKKLQNASIEIVPIDQAAALDWWKRAHNGRVPDGAEDAVAGSAPAAG